MATSLDLAPRRSLSPLAQLSADAERTRQREEDEARRMQNADRRANAADERAAAAHALDAQAAQQRIQEAQDKQTAATMSADIAESIQDPALVGKSFRQLDPYYRTSFATRYPRASASAQSEWDAAQRRNTGLPVGIPGLEEGETVTISPEGGVARQISADGTAASRITDKDLATAGVDPPSVPQTQRATALAQARAKALAPQPLADEVNRVNGIVLGLEGYRDIASQLDSIKEPGAFEKAAIVEQATPAEGFVSSLVRQGAQKAVSDNAMKFEAMRNRINSMMLFAGGGKALTPTEKALLTAVEPDDSVAVMKQKLGVVVPLLQKELKSLAANYPGRFKDAERALTDTQKFLDAPQPGTGQEPAKPGKSFEDAVKMLRTTPSLAPQFDARYGAGSAAKYLGR